MIEEPMPVHIRRGGCIMLLAIVRHGQTPWNAEGLFTGWADVGLSVKGCEEARVAGERLLEISPRWDAAYTSRQARASQTAELALGEVVEKSDLRPDWRLNERHVGALEGCRHSDVAQVHGDDSVARWRWGWDDRPPAMAADDPRQGEHRQRYGLTGAPPQCEALTDVIERVRPWLDEVARRHGRDERVVAFTHGTTLRALQVLLEALTPEAIRGVHPQNGAILVYQRALSASGVAIWERTPEREG